MSRNIRTDIALNSSALITTAADADFVYILAASGGNLKAMTVGNLKKVLGTPTGGVGDPNGTVDGPLYRRYYDSTPGYEREWVKTTGLGTLTGWV